MQKAVIVTGYWNKGNWGDTTETLNEYLSEGWKVVSSSPMGAYGYSGNGDDYNIHQHKADNGFASLVIIQKD